MRTAYSIQFLLSVGIILAANVLCSLCQHWAYRSVGFALCGLLWLVHPVLPKEAAMAPKALLWVRTAGFLLLLIGMFSRAYFY